MKNFRLCTKPVAMYLCCYTLMLAGCAEKPPEHSIVSEAPPAADQTADVSLVYNSRFATRVRVSYSDLMTLAEQEIPREHVDTGQQKICKKVIGLKVCGNAQWNYTVLREGDFQIQGNNDFVTVAFPMRFFGKAGIKGDVAKVLNLNALDFAGSLNARLNLKIDMDENWCPVINSEVQYEWVETPKIEWAAGLEFNLREQLDKAIAKQLAKVQEQATQQIDCDSFRNTIQAQWRSHSLPLEVPDIGNLFLNIEPTSFAFSGMRTEEDKLGLAFALNANTSVQEDSLSAEPLPLPNLERTDYQPGVTQFNVLIRAPYKQLGELAATQLVGQTFSEKTAGGDVSVSINNFELSGNPSGLTMNVIFDAKLPGSKLPVPGNLYLTATPVVDAFNQTIKLKNVELSNVLDSTLWNSIAKVFNGKIIAELENRAVLDVAPQLKKVESALIQQLNDSSRTGGLQIDASDMRVSLSSLIPETNNLAALVKVESQLEVNVPIVSLFNAR